MTDKLMELLVWALCDQRPAPPADAAYLYCQTQDNQASVFGAAQSIVREGLAKRILICDAPPVSGYPGYAAWKWELARLGIDGDIAVAEPQRDETLGILVPGREYGNSAAPVLEGGD